MAKISSDSGTIQNAVSGLQRLSPIHVSNSHESYSNIQGLHLGNESIKNLVKTTNSMTKMIQNKATAFTKVDNKKHNDDASLAQGFE